MFIQFHELLSITINSRRATKRLAYFLQIHRAPFKSRRNLFDTNDYAFMNFSLRPFDRVAIATRYWPTEALFAYISCRSLSSSVTVPKTNKTIHNLCAQMNVGCFLSTRSRAPKRKAEARLEDATLSSSRNISAYSFNFIIYSRTGDCPAQFNINLADNAA